MNMDHPGNRGGQMRDMGGPPGDGRYGGPPMDLNCGPRGDGLRPNAAGAGGSPICSLFDVRVNYDLVQLQPSRDMPRDRSPR